MLQDAAGGMKGGFRGNFTVGDFASVDKLNAAVRKAEELSGEKMGKLTAGMPALPGGMKFPF